MGSVDAKSQECGGRGWGCKWEVPAPRVATLYQAKSLPVWDPKPPVADQKGRPLLYLLSEQNSTGGRNPYPMPRETWQSLPSVGTSPAGSLARGNSKRPSLPLYLLHHCCHPSALLSPHHHRTQHSLSQLQQHHHSARGQAQALERLQLLAMLPSITYCNLFA